MSLEKSYKTKYAILYNFLIMHSYIFESIYVLFVIDVLIQMLHT